MNQNLTEIVVLLDASGSMKKLTEETISGFNTFLEDQKRHVFEVVSSRPGSKYLMDYLKSTGKQIRFTLVKFSGKAETLYNGVDITGVPPLNNLTYYPKGMTALYDTIGNTIASLGERLAKTPEYERPSKVLFTILTDGENTVLGHFSLNRIKQMITHQSENYKWEFLFLGANLDAFEVGESMGIRGANTLTYGANAIGTQSAFKSMSKSTTKYMNSGVADFDLEDKKWQADALK